MRQHGGNNDDPVLPAFILDNDDENLREIYVTNIDHIQADHQETELKNIYNFSTNNLHGGYREIRTQVREIYQNLHNAFRINLAFGTILFNNETREYRYFVPHYNSKILQYPFRISNMNSIRFLMNKLAGINIITQARSDRPSTAWSLAFITNVQYVVFKTEFPLGNAEDLPDYIKQNRNLKTMYIDKWTGKPYTDNLCFFRCLRQHFKGNKDFLQYFRVWMNFKKSEKLGNSTGQFTGVTMDEMLDLERCFNVKILIYSLSPDGVVCNLYKSVNNYDSKMYLNVHENHLSYIVDINKFAKKFQCEKCLKLFTREWNMQRHYKVCYDRTIYHFPGGFHKSPLTIFEKLESLGIHTSEESRYYKLFAVWDMEAMLQKTNHSTTTKLNWISKHVPISVSVASNITNFESPRCFINPDPTILIQNMMEYLRLISITARKQISCKYFHVLYELDELIQKYKEDGEQADSDFESEDWEEELESDESQSESDIVFTPSKKILSHFISNIQQVKKEFLTYISQLPIIGFNSGRYDLNLIKTDILKYISLNYTENEIFTIKKENSYLTIGTPHMKFLDISNYLAAGCSYEKFLKAYGCDIPKGVFPYEWFDSLEKLDCTSLPEMKDFYSTMKMSNPLESESEYEELRNLWNKNGMRTFRDYLIHYNNLDTGPFCEALTTFIDLYISEGIDIFKDYITLPGVARKMIYTSSESNFALFNSDNADLYYTFKQNIVGGPSIIFTRYQEKGVTKIKNVENNLCESVVGYDCNGLYSYAIKQLMPAGVYVRRFPENNFRPEVSERYIDSYVWLDYLSCKEGIKIRHKLNNQKEVRIGNFRVDGFCYQNKTVYEFNGCYYHGCKFNCFIVKNLKNKTWSERLKKVQQRDKARKNYIISQGYKFVAIQQCQFISKIKPKCLRFYEHYLPSYYRKNKGDLTHSKILTDVKNGRLFGALEVDIEVEEGHEDFFQEYPPFFATCEVPMEVIGSHMLSYCNANDIQFKSKRLLISGLKARKILLATPLLQWYLKNKCQVSKIYQIIEFQPKPSFTSFIDKVTHHRIQGELEADKAIIGDTFKLISNSSYGSFLMNKTKHSNVRYLVDKNKVRKIINSCIFKDMQDINGVFEVETYKSRIVMDNPIQIGFFILQYAKLRMLEFYYDCLLKYLRPQSFELTETDTDSLYMAINQSD